MNSEEIIDGLSDFDGFSPAKMKCKFCKLNAHDKFSTDSGFCKVCKNYAYMIQINRVSRNLTFQLIFIAILLYFFAPGLRSYILPLILIVYLPILAFGVLQYRFHYRGIPAEYRIVHQLKMYKLLRDLTYYNLALENWEPNIQQIQNSGNLVERILIELVDSVLLDGKPNPQKLFHYWGMPIDMKENQFIEHLIKNTSILDGLSSFGGTGLLPDIWPFISKDSIKETILDELVISCQELENASKIERKLFLEDLYLIEDELAEIIDDNSEWQIILEILDEFEPEIPPKNVFQQAQMQSAEQSKLINIDNEKMDE